MPFGIQVSKHGNCTVVDDTVLVRGSLSTYIPPITDEPSAEVDEPEVVSSSAEEFMYVDHCYENRRMEPLVESVITYVAGTKTQLNKPIFTYTYLMQVNLVFVRQAVISGSDVLM
jgi:hypothetical protein